MSKETETNYEPRFGYPIALNILGRRCVVVGGGALGGRKAAALAASGANVAIIAPSLGPEASVLVTDGKAVHITESFTPAHLDGAFLVIVATDNSLINAEVGRVATARGILVNQAAPGDGSESGDFATMATVRRGELLFAVTCGGASPGLSARLRRELSETYGLEWGMLVDLLGTAREMAQETIADANTRTMVMRRLVDRTEVLLKLIRAGEFDAANKEAFSCLYL